MWSCCSAWKLVGDEFKIALKQKAKHIDCWQLKSDKLENIHMMIAKDITPSWSPHQHQRHRHHPNSCFKMLNSSTVSHSHVQQGAPTHVFLLCLFSGSKQKGSEVIFPFLSFLWGGWSWKSKLGGWSLQSSSKAPRSTTFPPDLPGPVGQVAFLTNPVTMRLWVMLCLALLLLELQDGE